MLKVVGASWEQTRFTQILLIVVIIIAIFAIFFYEATPRNDDGCYAATAYWGPNTGFRLEFWGQNNDPNDIRLQVARAYYKPHHKQTGWASMEIQTNKRFDDAVQAKAAGQLEGSLSWQLIWWHWQNTVGSICMRREHFCQEIKRILEDNYKAVKAKAVQNDLEDPYWHQVNLYYIQLEGLFEGWALGKGRSRKHGVESLTFADILWLNHVKDIRDLEYVIETEKHPYNPKNPPTGLAVVKYRPNTTSEFLLSHSTAGLYSESLKVMKRYNFGYHQTANRVSGIVPGQNLAFTSYPGAIHSQDDFYQNHGARPMTIVGTRIKNYNPEAWNNINLATVIMGARVIAATRLANDAEEWSSHLQRYNSGTGSSAWLVLSREINYNLNLWLTEQVPGMTKVRNITESWKRNNNVIVCGIPHSKEVLNQNGFIDQPQAIKAAEYVKPIIKILQEQMDNVDDLEALHSLVTDPSIVQKARSDLQQNEEVVVFESMAQDVKEEAPLGNSLDQENSVGLFQKQPLQAKSAQNINSMIARRRKIEKKAHSGLIDLKMADGFGSFKGIAGPLYTKNKMEGSVPPFLWSDHEDSELNFHIGHPNAWDFPFHEPTWVW